MQAFVTGAAGFIGSSLVDRLLAFGHSVVGYDNFSTGQRRFLEDASKSPQFRLVEADLLNTNALRSAVAGNDIVFHLAANADVRFGTHHPFKDIEQNTIATYNVLEAMRANGITITEAGPAARGTRETGSVEIGVDTAGVAGEAGSVTSSRATFESRHCGFPEVKLCCSLGWMLSGHPVWVL